MKQNNLKPLFVTFAVFTLNENLLRILAVHCDKKMTLARHEIRDIMAEMSDITIREMMENSTATGAILRANEPWREAKAKLYYDFLQSMQTHFSEAQVFDVIADFIQNCTDTLDIIRGIKQIYWELYC